MKVLVTGANGFIGSSLVRYLSGNGYSVRGLIRAQADLKFLEGLDCDLLYADITNTENLEAATKGMDIVIHTAGLSSDWGDWNDFIQTNVEGTINMVSASARCGVKRFVHLSSVAVHWFGSVNGKEDGPTPLSHMAYAESKKQAEQWLTTFASGSAMEIVIVRPGNVYGPHDEKFIGPYLDFIKQKKFSYINGGRRLTCPTYIENLMVGIELACLSEKACNETFIITDGLMINWRAFTEGLLMKTGIPLPKRSVPFSAAYFTAYCLEMIYKLSGSRTPPLLTRYRVNNAGRNYHFSIEKAKTLLGYQPRVDFDTAVTRTIDWYTKQQRSF